MPEKSTVWARAIALVDLNAFFASVEQLDFPELRGRPVAVTNGHVGTCIITCSYEARHFGIKTGMRLFEARKKCPHLIQCATRPKRYAALSSTIMQLLEQISPTCEVFSIDEAFLDISETQHLLGSPDDIGKMIKRIIFNETGLFCSVGLSGDKTTAKFAAKLQKPNGLTLIPPWQAEERLKNVPVTELCGIAKGIGRYLANHGVLVCGDMKNIPMCVLSQRFGRIGKRIWLMAQGKDPAAVEQDEPPPTSVGHGKVMPPDSCDTNVLLTYFLHMSEKVAKRLRAHQLQAQKFYIGFKTKEGFVGGKFKLEYPGNDGSGIFQLCRYVVNKYWHNQGAWQVQVTALDPKPTSIQPDLFQHIDERTNQKNRVIDHINDKFGGFTIQPATMLNRSSMNDVIAPAWRPDGIRQSV